MNESGEQISFVSIAIILMLSNGLVSHVIINPLIIGTSGRDSWLVPLFTFIVMIPWCWAIVVLMRRTNQQSIRTWLACRIGAAFTWLLLLPLYAHIYIGGANTTLQTGTWAVANYLPDAPRALFMALLLLISVYAAIYGIRAIAIISGVLLPFVILLGYFVMTTNHPNKDFRLLTPVMEHGWSPVLQGMLYSCGCFMELAYLLPLQHHLKSRLKLWKLLILLFFFIHIMLGPLIGAITEFGPTEAAKQMLPPFEQWRIVHMGNYFEHVDFFALYQWMSGAAIRIGLSLFLIADLIPARRHTARKWTIAGLGTSYLLLAFFPIGRNALYEWQKFFYQTSIIMIAGSVFVWICITVFTKSKKERIA
ncbi:endospore germination permease [Paenibacillus oenotherae]|uniref:Endospore germination permease n=1 Tax=Paenibacillus oenotherae TaxID=1435645 RepID=A0ABS7D6E9_9BACL|nr:endospore germination permease [Paenibacillus oenotherae]MBW7475363.1 endospore germination permease [Paenibacillus oenotherae]